MQEYDSFNGRVFSPDLASIIMGYEEDEYCISKYRDSKLRFECYKYYNDINTKIKVSEFYFKVMGDNSTWFDFYIREDNSVFFLKKPIPI